jgi:Xaa-Pro aminopeptidase
VSEALATTRLDRLRGRLARAGIRQALLSHPETLAHLDAFEAPVEDWPVADPFVAGPPLLLLGAGRPVLVVPHFHATKAGPAAEVRAYRSWDHERAPDPWGELAAALDALELAPGPLGVEAGMLPLRTAELLRARGCEPVDVGDLVVDARAIKLPDEVDAIRAASRLADVAQRVVKEHAHAGISEAELAGLAEAAMNHVAGRRVPSILTVTAGEATSTGGGEATGRVLADGDLVLADVSPWTQGHWSDIAVAAVAGTPSAEQLRVHDAVRTALELAIDLCRPGIEARELDRRVRASLADFGPTYGHHTGHGIGASWSEEPRITPYNERRVEEGMAIALEPAVYRPGWGGIRLEHVVLVGPRDNELLTDFDHAF